MHAWLNIHTTLKDARAVFAQSLTQAAQAQKTTLQDILKTHADTHWGQRHGFNNISTYAQFCAQVPVQQYEDLATDIAAEAAGQRNTLCRDLRFFEHTGGSHSGGKCIPYTDSALNALQRALRPWLADLLHTRPGIMDGRAYWSISPATRAASQTLGPKNDALFFGEALAGDILSTLAVPSEIGAVHDIEQWRLLTLYYLLRAQDLRFISIWSPSFLLELLHGLSAQAETLLRALHDGRAPQHDGTLQGMARATPDNAARARQVAQALRAQPIDTTVLWPALDTLSCWADASAARFINTLQTHFPQAQIQPKGLLSTEGVVSIPWSGAQDPVLSVTSAFYEFVDTQGDIKRCHELQTHKQYRVIMTTYGGLYRYDTADIVQITGWHHSTPMLRFIGRAGTVSDLCGEKLTEPFVNAQLFDIRGFCLLAPSAGERCAYTLYLDAACEQTHQGEDLAQRIDKRLRKNPQYDYARTLGQLGALELAYAHTPAARYQHYRLAQGQQLGDIKPPTLSADAQWQTRFDLL